MGHQQNMEMLGHDDIIHHFEHRIIPLDALPQLLFHHLSQRRKHYMRCIAVTVGLVQTAGNLPKRLVKRICRADSDMIIPAAAVVM